MTQFVNCRLIRNHQIVHDDLYVRDGKILNPEKLFFDEKISADSVIDCHGALIAPGYIDLQFNGEITLNNNPNYSNHREAITSTKPCVNQLTLFTLSYLTCLTVDDWINVTHC